HGEDRSGSTPHPKPEDERDDNENGIEDESPGEKHRSYQLAFDQVNCEVKPSRQERLPKRVTGQQANEDKDHHAQDRAKNWHEVQQKGERPPEDRVGSLLDPSGGISSPLLRVKRGCLLTLMIVSNGCH